MIVGPIFPVLLRNLISLCGFLFLVFPLLRLRWTMKKRGWMIAGYCVIAVTLFTIWYYADRKSFGLLSMFGLLGFAAALVFALSCDPPFVVLFVLSHQFCMTVVVIVTAVFLGMRIQGGSIAADILARAVLYTVLGILNARWFRGIFRNVVDMLGKGWRFYSLCSLCINLALIFSLTWPDVVYIRSQAEQMRALFTLALSAFMQMMMVITLSHFGKEQAARQENELSKLNHGLMRRHLELLEESVADAKRVRHDLRHHHLHVMQYAQQGKTEELLAYLKNYDMHILSSGPIHICENDTVNNILSAYLMHTRQHGIEMTIDAVVPRNLPVDELDMVAILSNALENAVHGSLHSQKKNPRMEVFARIKDQKFVLSICNTCATDIVFEGGKPKTHRGVGISSMMLAVQKYRGETEFTIENGIFICCIMLNLPQ